MQKRIFSFGLTLFIILSIAVISFATSSPSGQPIIAKAVDANGNDITNFIKVTETTDKNSKQIEELISKNAKALGVKNMEVAVIFDCVIPENVAFPVTLTLDTNLSPNKLKNGVLLYKTRDGVIKKVRYSVNDNNQIVATFSERPETIFFMTKKQHTPSSKLTSSKPQPGNSELNSSDTPSSDNSNINSDTKNNHKNKNNNSSTPTSNTSYRKSPKTGDTDNYLSYSFVIGAILLMGLIFTIIEIKHKC